MIKQKKHNKEIESIWWCIFMVFLREYFNGIYYKYKQESKQMCHPKTQVTKKKQAK
jgi:hypothetical protein